MQWSTQNSADARVGTAKGKAVGRQGMRKQGGVEIQPVLVGLRPLHPAGEMLGPQLIALHALAARFGVDGVQVQAVAAGDQAVSQIQVARAARRRCGLCRDSYRCRDATRSARVGVLEPGHVVALPAVQADRYLLQGGKRRLVSTPNAA